MPRLPLAALLLAGCNEYDLKTTDGDAGGGTPDETAPVLFVDPTAIDFGTLPVGDASAETVTVRNDGDAALGLESVGLDLGDLAFSVTRPEAVDLDPGDVTTFVVTFSPLAEGAFSDAVLVRSTAPVDGTATVTLTGQTPDPWLVIDPESHDFGVLEVGDRAEVSVTVRNEGEGSARVTAGTFASSSPDELFVEDWGGLDAAGWSLDPGDEATIVVAYAPTDEEPDEATLLLDTTDPVHPELSATFEGTGEDPVISYDLTLDLTADDAWRGWVDGVEFAGANQNTWSSADTVSFTLESGEHVLAIYATDTAMAIAGLLAALQIDGELAWVTGDSGLLLTDTEPGAGWQEVGFDDGGWSTPVACADTSPWGSSMSALTGLGARWVWWTSDCRDLGEAWFRLTLLLP